ncbi:MAG: EAL domain-containing protein [Lachnospira sp.]|nr:EAL domain-containing protein [Lachnospira sp.]
MSKRKDKRIKKLKKQRIWPSVVGLIIIMILLTVIMAVAMAVGCVDIVQRKFVESSNESVKIAQLYEKYNDNNSESINDSVKTYVDMSGEIEKVGVLNSQGEKVWASGEFRPAIDNISEFDMLQIDKNYNVRVLVEEDLDGILVYENDKITISDNVFEKIEKVITVDEATFFSDSETNVLTRVKLWMVVSVGELEVFVLNDIKILSRDLFMLIVSSMLFLLLIVVFCIYYVVSFVSVLVNIRRTNKIIYTDMITGGDNWLHFVRSGTHLLKKNRKGKYNYAMLHLKMRKYRSFCTCFGVKEGEELIERFYGVLRKGLNKKETVAHHENAEFGLLVTYIDEQQLNMRIQELENALDAVIPAMKLYFAVGVYKITAGEMDVDQLYNNAVIACELLGEEAENKTAFFDVEMNKQKLWERRVEDDMDKALANKEFKVYLQPKINATQEQLAGAEALVRWAHPAEGFIPPNKFIPIFEKNGFILKLDDYMLEEISRQQAQWIAQGRKVVPISVNVSRAHFTREDLAEHISSIVDKYQVPHNVIELELTESAFFDDKAVLLNTVKKLRDAGFIVSMDDFGAGYSSLNSLKELQIDVLKIDADFFRGAEAQERGMLIVSEVIDLAKKLNMKIVAEGIESREQVDFLVEQECDLIQGYFYAKPMPIYEFIQRYHSE